MKYAGKPSVMKNFFAGYIWFKLAYLFIFCNWEGNDKEKKNIRNKILVTPGPEPLCVRPLEDKKATLEQFTYIPFTCTCQIISS